MASHSSPAHFHRIGALAAQADVEANLDGVLADRDRVALHWSPIRRQGLPCPVVEIAVAIVAEESCLALGL